MCVVIFVSTFIFLIFAQIGVSPLSASEELTQQYQSLVQVQQLVDQRRVFFFVGGGGGGGGGGLRT